MNNTQKNDSSIGFLIGVPWMIVYICETFLVVAGNSVTIYIFWKIRKTLKRTSYLLINLSVADLLVGSSIILQLLQDRRVAIVFGKEVRSALAYSSSIVGTSSLSASLFSLPLISLERMFAILWPFRHRVLETRYYFVSISVVWLLAALATVIRPFFSLGKIYRAGVLVAVIFSLLVITTAYSAIWIETKRNRMPNTASGSMVQNRKLARTLSIVTTLSFITWSPLCIVIILGLANGESTTEQLFGYQISIVLQYSNSFLNPAVYCFRMMEFKKSFKSILCRCPRRRRSIDHIPTEPMKEITLTSFGTVNSVSSISSNLF